MTIDAIPVAALAFAIAAGAVILMLRWQWRWAVDHPNERSLHETPTPRTGGIAVLLGIAAGAALAWAFLPDLPLAALLLAFMLAGISLVDDRGGLPITLRLATHLLAAGVYAAYLTHNEAPWWWMAGAVLAVAAMTNFYNFMDGANGLAGGMAVAGFATYAAAGAAAAPGFAAVCLAVAAAAAGFLCFNLRGSIFLGDGGSVPLGFLAAALGLEGFVRGLWPAWFPPLVFAPFALDASLTLVRRMLRGERFWQAHREHYYQRLVRAGWSHRRLALAEYAMMAACAAAALVARAHPDTRTGAFAIIALLFAAAAVAIDRKWRHFRTAVPPPS